MKPPVLWILCLLLFGCARSTTVTPPKLPAPGMERVSAALVWIMPMLEPEWSDPEETGTWEKPIQVRTLWVEPTGTGEWTVVSKRPGLYLTGALQLLELKWIITHRRFPLPPVTPQEHPNLSACRDFLRPAGADASLVARGRSLTLRNLSTGTKTDLGPEFPLPETLGYPALTERIVTVRGGLGPYLFVQVAGTDIPCGLRSDPFDEFEIFDFVQGARVTHEIFDAPSPTSWKKFFDRTQDRVDLIPDLRAEWKSYGEVPAWDDRHYGVSHVNPIFPSDAARVPFRVTVRYRADMKDSPDLQRTVTVEAVPPELSEFAEMHPAIAPVTAALPRGWRIGGLTVLSAPVADGIRLRRLFDTSGR